jgi:gamma-glutamyltranspeptidase / glutathione hydrolase
VQAASDEPRTFAFDGKLSLERTIAPAVKDDLAARGHTVEWSEIPIGGVQAIWIDHANGVFVRALGETLILSPPLVIEESQGRRAPR